MWKYLHISADICLHLIYFRKVHFEEDFPFVCDDIWRPIILLRFSHWQSLMMCGVGVHNMPMCSWCIYSLLCDAEIFAYGLLITRRIQIFSIINSLCQRYLNEKYPKKYSIRSLAAKSKSIILYYIDYGLRPITNKCHTPHEDKQCDC